MAEALLLLSHHNLWLLQLFQCFFLIHFVVINSLVCESWFLWLSVQVNPQKQTYWVKEQELSATLLSRRAVPRDSPSSSREPEHVLATTSSLAQVTILLTCPPTPHFHDITSVHICTYPSCVECERSQVPTGQQTSEFPITFVFITCSLVTGPHSKPLL